MGTEDLDSSTGQSHPRAKDRISQDTGACPFYDVAPRAQVMPFSWKRSEPHLKNAALQLHTALSVLAQGPMGTSPSGTTSEHRLRSPPALG